MNAVISVAANDSPTANDAYVVNAARIGADRPHNVITMNGVFFSRNEPLSNKNPLHNLIIPVSDDDRIFSGIHPARVGYKGVSERANAIQNNIWKCPASDSGPTYACVKIPPSKLKPNLNDIILDPDPSKRKFHN